MNQGQDEGADQGQGQGAMDLVQGRERRAAAAGLPLAQLQAAGAAGRPDEVIARCRAYGDVGASTMYLQVLDLSDLDHLSLVASEVLPALR